MMVLHSYYYNITGMKGITQRTVLQDQVAILTQRLAETSKALQSLSADEEDSILCPGGKSSPLISAQEGLVHSERCSVKRLKCNG
jgi:hypothetical protein